MGISTAEANRLLEAQVGKTSYTLPTIYVGVSTTTPTAGGTNITEPTGGGYARVATTGSDWGTAASGAITNANAFVFPEATADWAGGSNFTHGVLFDAPTGGTMRSFGAITTPKNALSGDTLSIKAGDLDITLS